MAHVLIETASFPEQITVPDPLDSGTIRAQDVAKIAQDLANRSRHARAVTDHAALKDAPQTFTGMQTFANGITASSATVNSNLTAGSITAVGALTANGGIKAAAPAQLTFDTKATALVGLDVNGPLNAIGGLGAAGASGGILTVVAPTEFKTITLFDNTLTLDPAVDISYGTIVDSLPLRSVQVNIETGVPVAGDPQYIHARGAWNPSHASVPSQPGALEFGVKLPRGTQKWTFQVLWASENAGVANKAEVFRTRRDFAVTLNQVQLMSGPELIAGVTQQNYTGSAVEAYLDNGPIITEYDPWNRYMIKVTLGAGSPSSLYGLRLRFYDPGARNG